MSKKAIAFILICLFLFVSHSNAEKTDTEIKNKEEDLSRSTKSRGNNEFVERGLQLRGLRVDSKFGFNHLSFLIKADYSEDFKPSVNLTQSSRLDNEYLIRSVQKLLEYFFIGLSMPSEKFWVNLSPQEPYRVIDSVLGMTDAGRIMLKADLQLKKDICRFTNPQISRLGRKFWDNLYAEARQIMPGSKIEIPSRTRLWIMPEKTVIYQSAEQAYIVKSRLKVCLEPAYLSQDMEIKRTKKKEFQDYSSRVMREIILPLLNSNVNSSPVYAELRQFYQALILAQWYKQKFAYQHASLVGVVDSIVLADAQLRIMHTPEQIYQVYMKSLRKGEYSFNEDSIQQTYFGTIKEVRHYFSGGVDFTNINTKEIDTIFEIQLDGEQYLLCDLFIPFNVQKPLQYAKRRLELSLIGKGEDYLNGRGNDYFVLVKNSGVITSSALVKESIQGWQLIQSLDAAL